jgi:hypothetical protein
MFKSYDFANVQNGSKLVYSLLDNNLYTQLKHHNICLHALIYSTSRVREDWRKRKRKGDSIPQIGKNCINCIVLNEIFVNSLFGKLLMLRCCIYDYCCHCCAWILYEWLSHINYMLRPLEQNYCLLFSILLFYIFQILRLRFTLRYQLFLLHNLIMNF